MGRCGTLHAWEQEDVVPDIQTIAKGLGGGYASIAAMMINHRVADALRQGTGHVASFLLVVPPCVKIPLTHFQGCSPTVILTKAIPCHVLLL